MALKSIFGKLLIFKILLISSVARVAGQQANPYYALEFEENKGQWGDDFQYKAQIGNHTVFLHPNGYTMLTHNEDDYARLTSKIHRTENEGNDKSLGGQGTTVRSHAYKVQFVGSNPNAVAVSERPIQQNMNYFLGNDSTRWKTGLSSYETITYKNVYPGVDVKYYSDGGRLKYDLIIEPGADISAIRLKYQGIDKLALKNRQLSIRISTGEINEKAPYTYRIKEGLKEEVECNFVIRGDEVRFSVRNHDPSLKLVIDPEFVFGTFSGSRSTNWGFSATPGPDGSLFGAGIVFGSGYPKVTTGPFLTTYGGKHDIAVSRYRTDGANPRVMYSLVIGGKGEDWPHSIISDANGNLFILGRTNSSDYPVKGYQSTNRGATDIIVTKINAAGSVLMGSAVIGGKADDGQNISDNQAYDGNFMLYSYGDNARSEVILDANNDVLISACTNSDDFPVQNAFQSTKGGKQDAVVLKLSSDLSNILFSSYLGGTDDDAGFCIKLHPTTNEIFVAGPTSSKDFPGNKTGTIGAVPGNAVDGYVAVISSNGSAIVRSTYLATNSVDIVYGLAFDKAGFPYVAGITRGSWPVLNAAYSNPGAKQFISKLRPDLSGYEFSTVFGAPNPLPNISIVGFLVDRCDNIYVSGWGGSLGECFGGRLPIDNRNSGTFGMPTTRDALRTITDNRDFYAMVLRRNAGGLLYGSFIGQRGGAGDHVDGGTSRFDERGALYMAVCANCGGGATACGSIQERFPLFNPAYAQNGNYIDPGNRSRGDCNLGAIKIAFGLDGVRADIQPSINGVVEDSVGCSPLKVDFEDVMGLGMRYIWDFDDGTPPVTTTTPFSSHVFLNPGVYRVSLTAINDTMCVPIDVVYQTINVGINRVTPQFSVTKLPPCDNFTMRFENLSVAPVGPPFGSNTFTWDFGDNSPKVKSGPNPVSHTFPAEGVYNVKLTIEDTAYCNAPVTLSQVVRISKNVKADFSMTPDTACTPLTYEFKNFSFNGQTFEWDFGDGTTFTGFAPPLKTYATIGTYQVKLKVRDPNTCNLIDSITKTLVVELINPPQASFTYSPNPSEENTPTLFTNTSTDAVRYKWEFGDGRQSTQKNPQYQYVGSAINKVCLTAYNILGCFTKKCDTVVSKVVNYFDVPNAFTPNGDGKNDKVAVRGFGIVKMDFKIFNRWGQLVFRSTDPLQGWDGYFQGRLQPMDVYGYTLEIETYDGQGFSKKGDITLLR